MNWKMLSTGALFTLLASCAFAPGPAIPLGLGPGFDEIVPWLLVVVLIVGLGVWKLGPDVARRFRKPVGTLRSEEREQLVIRQRYARGELTRDEFLRISEDLKRRF